MPVNALGLRRERSEIKYKVSFFKGFNPAKGRGIWTTSRQALASGAA